MPHQESTTTVVDSVHLAKEGCSFATIAGTSIPLFGVDNNKKSSKTAPPKPITEADRRDRSTTTTPTPKQRAYELFLKKTKVIFVIISTRQSRRKKKQQNPTTGCFLMAELPPNSKEVDIRPVDHSGINDD